MRECVLKFNWRLDRILEIKRLQEDILRGELAAIIQQKMSLQSQIMLIKANTKTMLLSLKRESLQERLSHQQFVMSADSATRIKIESLLKEIESLKEKTSEKKAQILAVRKARKGLEKLREKALEKFEKEYHKKEQNEIDEVSIVANARSIVHKFSYMNQ